MKTEAIESAIRAAETFCKPEGPAMAECARAELAALKQRVDTIDKATARFRQHALNALYPNPPSLEVSDD